MSQKPARFPSRSTRSAELSGKSPSIPEPPAPGQPAMPAPWYALSVKQPWAALLAAGVKTVEIRTWSTPRRGRILIHAGKIPDSRPEAWAWVTTPELVAAAELVGGIVGIAELTGCISYKSRPSFVADRGRHLNEPDWWVESGLYGFSFRDARPVEFERVSGNTFFFPVSGWRGEISEGDTGDAGRRT